MSGKVGSITTPIVVDGLIFNMDAANRSSYPKTGTIVTDTIGNTSGTLNGATFSNVNSGIFNFDGTDDRIEVNSFTPLNGATSLTTQLWFKADTYSSLGSLFWFDDHIEIYQGNSIYTNLQGRNYYRLSGHYGIPFATLGGTLASGVGNLCDGNWHNICIAWDGATSIIYEDTVAVITAATPGTLNTATDNIYIGTNTLASNPFQGEVANIQLYNRALSASEVLQNYNALKGRFGL